MQLDKVHLTAVLALLVTLVLTGSASARGVNFQPRIDYPTAYGPVAVAVGDLNRDGRTDIVVTNYGSGAGKSLSVFLGNGDGTLQAPVDYETGYRPSSVAIAYLNRDRWPDLAVVNEYYLDGYSVSVFLGKGDGTFRPRVNYPTADAPHAIAIGDFNGDEKADLAVAIFNYYNGNLVSVLLGNGDGSFQPHVDYTTQSGPTSVATGDLNNDGKIDLAVGIFNGSRLNVLLGNGDGTFQPFLSFGDYGGGESIAVGDFNRDGKPDVVTTNYNFCCSVSVFLGNGDGTFQPPVDYAAGPQPLSVAVGDFNVDGKADLAVANTAAYYDGNTVSVFLGNGDGSFMEPTNYITGFGPMAVAVSDFNHDGAADLVTANWSESTLSVLLNNAGTKLALTSSTNPSPLGEPVTFTLTVAPTFPGVGTPRGMVGFKDGTQTIGTAPLVSGQASFTTSDLTVGSHTIRAVYSGDRTFNKNKSAPLVQQVE